MAFLIPLGGRTELHKTWSDSWVTSQGPRKQAIHFRVELTAPMPRDERVPRRTSDVTSLFHRAFPPSYRIAEVARDRSSQTIQSRPMSKSSGQPPSSTSGLNRRDFIKGSAVTAAFPAAGAEAATLGNAARQSSASQRKPNIVLYISDQFRWDMVSAYGLNPMQLTPNLDAMARRGTLFRSHITNQPVCAPSRAGLFTGQYQNKHGVWRNGPGLAPDATTLATELRKAGYTANYIGKWHLAPRVPGKEANTDRGRVAPAERGGFLDFWEGSNELEWTSHPYEGEIYDGAGKAIPFADVYRADFITQRAQQFLNNVHGPFLLVISQLEVHQQNDCNCFVAPKEYAGKYTNPFVPGDLKALPGTGRNNFPTIAAL